MIEKELAPGVIVFNDIFDCCPCIIAKIENVYKDSLKQAQVIDHEGNSHVYPTVRFCEETAIEEQSNDPTKQWIYEKINGGIEKALMSYIGRYPITRSDITRSQFTIMKYGIDGKFNYHVDDGRWINRLVSIGLYLNEDYTGGELFYPHFNINYKPKAGDVIIFPSNYMYGHEVRPVTEGTRYAVIGWYSWNA